MECGDIGPNGRTIGFDEEGNYVELLEDTDEQAGEPTRPPIILQRGDSAIGEAYSELRDKLLSDRHEPSREQGSGEEVQSQRALWDKARTAAIRMQEQHSLDALVLDDFEYAVLYGRMSALAWVMGDEWKDAGSR